MVKGFLDHFFVLVLVLDGKGLEGLKTLQVLPRS